MGGTLSNDIIANVWTYFNRRYNVFVPYLVPPNPCASKPCANEGECIPVGFYNFRCKCNNGYTGKQCEGTYYIGTYFILRKTVLN